VRRRSGMERLGNEKGDVIGMVRWIMINATAMALILTMGPGKRAPEYPGRSMASRMCATEPRMSKTLHGHVIGADGKPIAGAEVTNIAHLDPLTELPVIKTDKEGNFTLVVDADHPILLRARYEDAATIESTAVVGGEADGLVLRLTPHAVATLSGRVVDASGTVVNGTTVDLAQWAFARGITRDQVRADKEGRYTFASLWPGVEYTIAATAPGYSTASSAHVVLKPGEVRALDPLALNRADKSVFGRVVNEKGTPLVGEEILLIGGGNEEQKTRTDNQGHYHFDHIADGALRLLLRTGADTWSLASIASAGGPEVVLVQKYKNPTGGNQEQEAWAKLRGQPAPPLAAMTWINTGPQSAKSLRNKIVVIDFWAINCGPCVAALPDVQRVASQYRDRGVVVIGVHDASLRRAQLAAFVRQHKLTYPVAIDAPDKSPGSFGQTFRRYGVIGIPVVVVIDTKKKVAYMDHSLFDAVKTIDTLLSHRKKDEPD